MHRRAGQRRNEGTANGPASRRTRHVQAVAQAVGRVLLTWCSVRVEGTFEGGLGMGTSWYKGGYRVEIQRALLPDALQADSVLRCRHPWVLKGLLVIRLPSDSAEATVLGCGLATVMSVGHRAQVLLVVAVWPLWSLPVDVVDVGCRWSSPLGQGEALCALACRVVA